MTKKFINISIMLLFCFVVTLIFCYPFLNQMIFTGPDTTFHINRIEALSIALKNNDVFPRVFFHQNFNFGYGSPLFYSIFFLYFPALLRNNGYSVFDAYRFFLLVSAFLSALSMYICAKKILGKKPIIYTWFTVLFYVWNCFYMSDFYKRGAVGEVLAFIFIPIVIVGMVESVHGSYLKHFILIFGFTGLLLAHNISFVLLVILYAIYLLLNIKTLLNDKRRILYIGLITLVSVLLTAFFLFPMLEQLSGKLYRINNYFGTSSLVDTAMNFTDIFDFRTDQSKYLCDSVGPFLLFVPLLYPFVRRKQKTTIITYFIITGYILVLMTTNLFPWKYFNFMSFLQFPTRLLIPACSLLALGAGYTIANLPINKHIKPKCNIILLIVVLITAVLQLFGYVQTPGYITKITPAEELTSDEIVYNRKEWYSVIELSTPDYLPANTDIHYRDYVQKIETNSVETVLFNKPYQGYNDLTFSTPKFSNGDYFIVPLTYYKGYVAEVYEGDKLLTVLDTTMDETLGLVRMDVQELIPEEEYLTVKVKYLETKIQTSTLAISKTTFYVYSILLVLQLILVKLYKYIIKK